MRLSGLTLAVLTFSCAVLAGSAVAVAATNPESPAPKVSLPSVRPENTLSSADIEQLRQTIKGLHQRFEDQAKILENIDSRLETLDAHLEQGLRPADLDSLRQGMGTLVARVGETRTAVTQLAEALDKTSSDNGGKLVAASAQAARLQEQIASLANDLARWQRDLTARAPAVAAPVGVDLGTMIAVVAVATLLIGGLVLYFGMKPRGAPQTEAVFAVASLGKQIGQLREHLATQTARSAPPGEPLLNETVKRLQSLIERLEAAATVPEPAAVARPVKSVPLSPIATAETAAAPAALWPEPFRDPASPLARWRTALESDLSSDAHSSLPVVAALLALRVVVGRPAPGAADVGNAVAALSEVLHHYWQSLPDLTEDELVQASGDWIDTIRTMIAVAASRLSIEQVVPGFRIDPDTMQTVRQGSGNHLTVAAVYSWVIRDLSGERPKVLHRARVATT
jgi:hypothetical protein